MRGLAYTQVRLHGPDKDVHSGFWGGRIPNPLNELVRVLGQLWDADRRVTIDGFYDAVVEPTPQERAQWAALNIDVPAMMRHIGLGPEADIGEAGYTSIEREWCRPTAEINGLWGGYTGAGAKTVIPAYATAKVSFRLVADQNPKDIAQRFFAWLQARTPPGCRWEFEDMHGGHPASVDPASPWLAKARRAIERATGPGGGADQDRRLDPRRGDAQGPPGPGYGVHGLCVGRRPRALAQREVRAAVLPDGRPVARGAAGHARGSGVVTQAARCCTGSLRPASPACGWGCGGGLGGVLRIGQAKGDKLLFGGLDQAAFDELPALVGVQIVHPLLQAHHRHAVGDGRRQGPAAGRRCPAPPPAGPAARLRRAGSWNQHRAAAGWA
ncbi:MAG: hypothetical protein KatS3mg103_0123 [Phycisphaerales bacterium]|nr:MAG: hypothetical protein KatS3mg103_0123 [Phycisphaerales bacterium]